MAKVTPLLSGRARLDAQFSDSKSHPALHSNSRALRWEEGGWERRDDLSEVPWLVGGRVAIRSQTCNGLYSLNCCSWINFLEAHLCLECTHKTSCLKCPIVIVMWTLIFDLYCLWQGWGHKFRCAPQDAWGQLYLHSPHTSPGCRSTSLGPCSTHRQCFWPSKPWSLPGRGRDIGELI